MAKCASRPLSSSLGVLPRCWDAARSPTRRMGYSASKEPAAPAPGPVAFAAANPLAPMTPTARAAAQARTVRLLESLAAKEERVEQPVLSNSERWRSGQRGMTRALLFGVKAFYAQHGALDKTMQDIVNEPGFPFSACADRDARPGGGRG